MGSHPHSCLHPAGHGKRTEKGTLFGLIHHTTNKVKTNIGKIFLKLVDKHFPKSNKLHKIFNRNTLKVSYSCTENMAQIIKKHNKKITNTTDKSTDPACNYITNTTDKSTNPACNFRIKTKYPLNGNCLQPSVTTKPPPNPKTT